MKCSWTWIAVVVMAGTAQAEDWNPLDWTGAWYAPGEVRARALWLEEGRLRLQVPHTRGRTLDFVSSPTLTQKGLLAFRADRRRITLRPLDADRLAVVRSDGRTRRTEVWLRSGRPTVRLVGTTELRRRAGRPARIPVEVKGRTQRVVLEIRARAGYAKLGGLVHYEERTLAIGRAVFSWSGKDRSFAERPLRPGRYLVIVRPADEILRPKRAADHARLSLTITARPAPAPPLQGSRRPIRATKRPGRLSRVGARSGMIPPPRAKRLRHWRSHDGSLDRSSAPARGRRLRERQQDRGPRQGRRAGRGLPADPRAPRRDP